MAVLSRFGWQISMSCSLGEFIDLGLLPPAPLPPPLFQVKPIAVADMLSLGKGGGVAPQDSSGVTSAVQSFLNNVISMTG